MERKPEPCWAAPPPRGLSKACFEVIKDGKLLHRAFIWPKKADDAHVTWHDGGVALLFGRWGGADVVCEHPSLSRQHAWVGWDEQGRTIVQDLGSAAGTKVNGTAISAESPVALREGDEIQFAESSRLYQLRELRQDPAAVAVSASAEFRGQAVAKSESEAAAAAAAVDSSVAAHGAESDGGFLKKRKKEHTEKESKKKKKKTTTKKHKKEKKSKRHKKCDGAGVSDDEADFDDTTEYTRCTASHILVKDKDTAWDVLAELEDGADFAILAREHSTCPSGKERGGSLGTFGKGKMVPEFDEVAFNGSFKIGTVHGPIKTEFGFHLITVHKRAGVGAALLG